MTGLSDLILSADAAVGKPGALLIFLVASALATSAIHTFTYVRYEPARTRARRQCLMGGSEAGLRQKS
jgi:hypothetical protein